MRFITIMLIPWLFCIITPAQGEEHKEYKVEMILFSHEDSQAKGAQRKEDDMPGPDLENASELSWDPALSEYVILSEFEKDLSPVVAELNRSARYQVIMHLIWRQSIPTRTLARPLHIHGGSDFSRRFPIPIEDAHTGNAYDSSDRNRWSLPLEQVDGTITLFLGRYLHVHTDLIYRRPAGTTERDAEATEDDSIQDSKLLVDYRIRNNRKMRSAELHYLDHPLLGILLQITPIETISQP